MDVNNTDLKIFQKLAVQVFNEKGNALNRFVRPQGSKHNFVYEKTPQGTF